MYKLLIASLLSIIYTNMTIACSVCFGLSDGPLKDGINWSILGLLFIIATVLLGFASFFIVLVRKAAKVNAKNINRNLTLVE